MTKTRLPGSLFSPGDKVVRVRNDKDRNSSLPIGAIGTVIGMFKTSTDIILGISWEDFTGGHDLTGNLTGSKKHSGWNVPQDQVELFIDPVSLDILDLL